MTITVLVAMVILVMRLIQTRDVIGNASFIAVLMIIAAFVLRTNLLPYLAARKLWLNLALKDELRGSVDQNGITYHLKVGENRMTWNRFVRVRRKSGLNTLVARDGLLLVFPRRFFQSDRDWDGFNQLLDARIISPR